MNFTINEKQTISEIQQRFLKAYPYLKIEFYKGLHASGEGSAKNHIINGDLTLSEIQNETRENTIVVSDDMKVSTLEEAFAAAFDIGAQVFRKSGNVWLQTTTTDDLTLSAQNQKAIDRMDTPDDEIIDAMDRQELE